MVCLSHLKEISLAGYFNLKDSLLINQLLSESIWSQKLNFVDFILNQRISVDFFKDWDFMLICLAFKDWAFIEIILISGV